jgi:hypothetical protein
MMSKSDTHSAVYMLTQAAKETTARNLARELTRDSTSDEALEHIATAQAFIHEGRKAWARRCLLLAVQCLSDGVAG